jgi:S1/P1 Nuclease
MDLHRFWDGVITSSSNLTRLRNEATALRNRQGFQRSQLTELASTEFASWAKESFEIATKIAYRNGGRIGIPKGGNKDCRDVRAAPVLPAGYVVSASRMADRRMILAGYRLADLLTRVSQTFDRTRKRRERLLIVSIVAASSNRVQRRDFPSRPGPVADRTRRMINARRISITR